MITRPAASLVFVALATVLVAGCGAPSSPVPSRPPPTGAPVPTPAPSATPSAAQLLVRVTSEGGFIGPAATLAALPAVSAYADGRILTPAPPPAEGPAPLLPGVLVHDVGPAGAAAIVAAIRAAGLDTEAADVGGIVADTGSTVIAVTLDGRTVTTRLRGSGGGPPGPGGPGAGSPDPAAAAAAALVARLEDPGDTWGAPAAPTTTLEPAGFRIFAAPGAPPADPSATAPSVAWPLATPLAGFGTPAPADRGIAGLRQGVALGADAVTLAPVLAAASTATGFTSGGTTWTLYVRPLLPDELNR